MSAPLGDRPLALVGLRASGKTSVGRELARRLGRRFVDLDEETLVWARCCEHTAADVGALLVGVGELTFRELEAHVLRRALEGGQRIVLATGGGAVERADNRAWLRRAALTVWLSVSPEVLRTRLAQDGTSRPALEGGDALSEVEHVARRRAPLYREVADLVAEAAEGTPAEVAERIVSALAAAEVA